MPEIVVGDKVEKGQIIARVYGIPDGLTEISAPIDGLVMYRHMFGPTSKNERVVTISPD